MSAQSEGRDLISGSLKREDLVFSLLLLYCEVSNGIQLNSISIHIFARIVPDVRTASGS